MIKHEFEYEVTIMGRIVIEAETEDEARQKAHDTVADGYFVKNGSLTGVEIH